MSVVTVKRVDVPEALLLDRGFEAKYTEYLTDLKTGEDLIIAREPYARRFAFG